LHNPLTKCMKAFPLPVFLFLLAVADLRAQSDIHDYLKTHSYAFTLESGFDSTAQAILKQKFAPYKVILQGEGGSHYLKMYNELPAMWLSLLNSHFGVTHFFGESGHSSDILINHYFKTGDTGYLFPRNKAWATKLYQLNNALSKTGGLTYFGIDFEGSRQYVNAIKLLLPGNAVVPEPIRPDIELIKGADGSIVDCIYILSINAALKKSIAINKPLFESYFGAKYADLERMVFNGRTCKETLRDRNPNMAANFISFDQLFQQPMYFGELGMAHTSLNTRASFASIINNTKEFKNKVCVINLYCDNCSTKEEGPSSNWQLGKIEKDIITLFLPFCKSTFTLFDLTENPGLVGKYSVYGQFLVIAKKQD